MSYKKISTFLILLTIAITSFAQLQSPYEFIDGYGSQFTPHHQLIGYFEYIAANSDHVKLVPYGKTNGGRPLIIAIVSSPENINNIEKIRHNNLIKTGLEKGVSDAALDRSIVWLSYSVHGNEAGGSESSMLVLHQLSDKSNTEIQTWLKNTIVILDPSLNPDGYARYTNWYRDIAPKDANPIHGTVEHNEPWPKGRFNHYLFDLNRDWAWQTQVESQQRMKIYHRWMPHIHADLHEQFYQNPYYFAPAAEPMHQYISQWQKDFQIEVGKNHAKYFDENGWLYFTHEIFDLFYPSYGDTYPIFNGAVGMTYEQAGHSKAGRGIIIPNSDTLTLADRIAHHTTTSLSTVEVASKNMERIVLNFKDFFDQSSNHARGKYKAYVIKHTNNKDRMKALCQLLDKNEIKYGTAIGSKGVDAFDYNRRADVKLKVENGDLVISATQPMGVLAQVLFDPNSELSDSLTYDITAWALPYAYGLEAYASKQNIKIKEGYDFTMTREQTSTIKHPYAYICKWQSMADVQFLGALEKQGIKVRVATAPFTIEASSYTRGTIIITRADNRKKSDLDQIIQKIAKKYNRHIDRTTSGFSDNGADMGSDKMKLLNQPKVAVLSGKKTNPSSFGFVWSYFEQDLNYPISIFKTGLMSIDLDAYNVLIIPEGKFYFSFKEREKMKSWVQAGGQLIVIGLANREFAGQEGFDLKKKESDTQEKEEAASLLAYDAHERKALQDANPGAIFKVKLDTSHPLAYGLLKDYFSLKVNTLSYPYLSEEGNVGVLTDDLEIIGFVGHSAKERFQNTLSFGCQKKGSGNIIYLMDDPLFRCFWKNGKFLFSNAVFMVGQE